MISLDDVTTAQAALVVSGVAGAVGLYGAVNAHRAMRWQRLRDAERARKHVSVGIVEEADIDMGVSPPTILPRVTLMVVNKSQTATVYVERVELRPASGEGGLDLNYGREDKDEPTRLEPNQQMRRQFVPDDLNWDAALGVIAWVQLTTGERFESKVFAPTVNSMLRRALLAYEAKRDPLPDD